MPREIARARRFNRVKQNDNVLAPRQQVEENGKELNFNSLVRPSHTHADIKMCLLVFDTRRIHEIGFRAFAASGCASG